MMKISKKAMMVLSFFILIILGVIIIFDDGSSTMNILRLIFGTIGLLLLPGRWITEVSFSKKEIDLIERIALSIALSISVVPLAIFYLNLGGFSINEFLVLGVVVVIFILCSILSLFQK